MNNQNAKADKGKTEIIECGRFCVGKCSNKDDYFLFDASSKHVVCDYKWCVDGHGYVCRYINGKVKRLHTLIIENAINSEVQKGLYVDHINEDKLDNRLCNLRLVTPQDSARNMPIRSNNTSGSTGVAKGRGGIGYRAYINVNKQRIDLGTYKTFEEAVSARHKAENYYGFISKQNLADVIKSADTEERNRQFDKINRETAKINDEISRLKDESATDTNVAHKEIQECSDGSVRIVWRYDKNGEIYRTMNSYYCNERSKESCKKCNWHSICNFKKE